LISESKNQTCLNGLILVAPTFLYNRLESPPGHNANVPDKDDCRHPGASGPAGIYKKSRETVPLNTYAVLPELGTRSFFPGLLTAQSLFFSWIDIAQMLIFRISGFAHRSFAPKKQWFALVKFAKMLNC